MCVCVRVCTCVHVCMVGLGVLSECVQSQPVHLTSNVRHCCIVSIPPTLIGNHIVGVGVHVCVISRWMLACIIIGGCTGCECCDVGIKVWPWVWLFGCGCLGV